MPDTLFLEERRRAILNQLDQQGRVTVKELSKDLQVSAVTIRQDLRALETRGLLERTYGGAVARIEKAPLQELSFTVRQSKRGDQKTVIAQAAAALVEDGYSIALDSSTTVFALASFLKQYENLTIVTNSLILAQSFLDHPTTQVLLPGGRLRRDSVSLVGQPESLPTVNLNIGFFSARGIAEDIGASEIDPDEVIVKRAMFNRCVRAVLLVDSSKWGQVAPYTLIPPEKVTHIISTDQAALDLVQHYRNLGAQVDLLTV
ncbi:MAG: DeoR/GlpR transcriptional regulator [Anaerolineae bacterium]|nr:DeoR/GlpR transcriptional regulator [Anaerolineae bacterium]